MLNARAGSRYPATGMSPLMLTDRLLTLAQDADRAGLSAAALQILQLATAICDHPAPPRPPALLVAAE